MRVRRVRECERRDEFIQGAQMELEGNSTDLDPKYCILTLRLQISDVSCLNGGFWSYAKWWRESDWVCQSLTFPALIFMSHLVKTERGRIRWRKEGGKSEEEEEDRRMLQEWPAALEIPHILQFEKEGETREGMTPPQAPPNAFSKSGTNVSDFKIKQLTKFIL